MTLYSYNAKTNITNKAYNCVALVMHLRYEGIIITPHSHNTVLTLRPVLSVRHSNLVPVLLWIKLTKLRYTMQVYHWTQQFYCVNPCRYKTIRITPTNAVDLEILNDFERDFKHLVCCSLLWPHFSQTKLIRFWNLHYLSFYFADLYNFDVLNVSSVWCFCVCVVS